MASSVCLNPINGAITTLDSAATPILSVPIFDTDVTLSMEVNILARRQSSSDAKMWHQVMLIDKTADANPTSTALVNLMTPSGTLGSATWNFSTTFDNDHAVVNVIGQSGATINWFATASALQVMGD